MEDGPASGVEGGRVSSRLAELVARVNGNPGGILIPWRDLDALGYKAARDALAGAGLRTKDEVLGVRAWPHDPECDGCAWCMDTEPESEPPPNPYFPE